MTRNRITCLMILAVALSACETPTLPPPALPSDTRPIKKAIHIGGAPVEAAEQIEIKTIVFGKNDTTSGRMIVTTRSIMDAASRPDFLRLRAEIVDTDVAVSGSRPPLHRKLAARLQDAEGTIIEFDQNRRTGKVNVRVIQHGAMITLHGTAAAKIANLIQQSYLAGRSVRQGEEVMKIDLSHILSGIDPLTEEASLSGRVEGAAQFRGRPVIVVAVKGTIDDDGSPVQVAGTYLVDKSTGIAIRSDLALAGLRMQETEVHVAISQEVRL